MSHLFSCLLFCLITPAIAAQHTWEGGAGTDQWNDPLNWSGNSLPAAASEVLLDNSVVAGSYKVVLPANMAITVESITINPASGNTIELVLPAANALVPALTTTATPYGLVVNKGGIFRNASGSNSGLVYDAQDSIRINNGGRYIHNSGASHAANVSMLSLSPGTEGGVWEFDIPDASSTISLSGRTFGALELSANTGTTPKNYTGAGTNLLKVRSEFIINPGVALKLNFDDSIIVDGDFMQNGGTVDLGTTARSADLIIKRNCMQAAGGLITVSGTATQQISLAGSGEQQLNMQGAITNAITLNVNNSDGVRLTHALSVSSLKLTTGVLQSSTASMLTLLAGGAIIADTVVTTSYIGGPIKKQGLANEAFLFPVGGQGRMRWMMVHSATGDVTAEYVHEDPRTFSTSYAAGIDHISTQEYWKLEQTSPGGFPVTLSFNQQQSGEVSSLADLRVGALTGTSWEDMGNGASGGSPGFVGWVKSSTLLSGTGTRLLMLASSTASENALPQQEIILTARIHNDEATLNWRVSGYADIKEWHIQHSLDGKDFKDVYKGLTPFDQGLQQWKTKLTASDPEFRIEAVDKHGIKHYSNVVVLHARGKQSVKLMTVPSPLIEITSPASGHAALEIFMVDGRMASSRRLRIQKGKQQFQLGSIGRPGLYLIKIVFEDGLAWSSKLIKK